MPPDKKQACIEDFFLSSARLPDTQPSSPSAEQRLSACRFAVSAAEHYDELSSTQYADMHWHVPRGRLLEDDAEDVLRCFRQWLVPRWLQQCLLSIW